MAEKVLQYHVQYSRKKALQYWQDHMTRGALFVLYHVATCLFFQDWVQAKL